MTFQQFYALRSGWRVFPSRRQRLLTAVMVGVAILFMICTLHMTRIYNRGVDISATLTSLEESEAEIRYGELERRLLDAQVQLGDAAIGLDRAADDRKLSTVRQIAARQLGATSSFYWPPPHRKPPNWSTNQQGIWKIKGEFAYVQFSRILTQSLDSKRA